MTKAPLWRLKFEQNRNAKIGENLARILKKKHFFYEDAKISKSGGRYNGLILRFPFVEP